MNIKVIIINGYAGVGKSTFVKYCKIKGDFGRYPYKQERPNLYNTRVLEFSAIDPIKEIATGIGWDGQKNPKDRKFLSDLKDLLTDYNDFPFKQTIGDIRTTIDFFKLFLPEYDDCNVIIFIHCREPKEIERFKNELGARSLIIRRHESEVVEQINHADNGVFDAVYDYTIFNEGSLVELEDAANEFIEQLDREDWESHIPKIGVAYELHC